MPVRPLPPVRPAVGERVELTVTSSGTRLVGVVDDVGASGDVVLREPVDQAGAPTEDLPQGAALRISWQSPKGRHELDAVLARFSHDRMSLWHLSSAGEPRTTQQRRYARASDALQARLVRGTDTFRAVIADLSEGGARCVVVNTRAIATAEQVVLHMTVDAAALGLPAQVLEVSPLSEGRSQLRLQFLDIGRDADIVRRRVLEQQRRSRTGA